MTTERLDMDLPVEATHWKVQTWNKKNDEPRALYVPYFDARDMAGRLDDLFGWDGWDDSYEVIPTSNYLIVKCTLLVRWERSDTKIEVRKEGMAELTGQGDTAVKGGESDAFKRACMKLGVGRNAYDLPTVWASCDLWNDKPRMPRKTSDGRPFEDALREQASRQIGG